MRVDEKLTRNLAHSADVLNSVNGGTIFPTFETTKEEDHYRMEVSTPSVDPDSIKVEVNGGLLLIYQRLEQGEKQIPNMLGVHQISAEVQLDHITAGFEEDLLVVIMPFNEYAGGTRREIDIIRN